MSVVISMLVKRNSINITCINLNCAVPVSIILPNLSSWTEEQSATDRIPEYFINPDLPYVQAYRLIHRIHTALHTLHGLVQYVKQMTAYMADNDFQFLPQDFCRQHKLKKSLPFVSPGYMLTTFHTSGQDWSGMFLWKKKS